MKIIKWILGVVLSIMLGAAISLGAWNLNKTAELPEKYATKVEVDAKVNEIKTDAANDRKQIRDDISHQIDEVQTEQRYIRDAVDEIKRILINNR